MNDNQLNLDGAYTQCRRYHRWHGRTFYLATSLLPADARRHVSALYSFARYADDIVDEPEWAGRRDLRARQVTPEFVALIRFEVERVRNLYVAAEPGIRQLRGRSASCVRLAARMYEAILDDIERHGDDVFTRRARVTRLRRAELLLRAPG